MTYLFFVQGEGRGHMTQALTLKGKLENRGHQVLAVVVGTDKKTETPSFFREQVNIPLFRIDSPNFVVAKDGRGIKIMASLAQTIGHLASYLKSLKTIKKIINDFNPDALVSFYEPLAGNYYRFSGDKRPMFCIGHQYFLEHPSFHFPPGDRLSKFSLKFYNHFAAPRRSVKILLSFTAEKDIPTKKSFVCPPLLRPMVRQQNPTQNDFLLVYMLNAGYGPEIINWSRLNPGTKIEAFWNKPGEEITSFSDNLIFHRLNAEKFINRLATCRAFASTAGFESIAEAAYLQKDILMVPTAGHFEQKCNAVDAARAGLAIMSENFNLSLLTDEQTKTHSFKTSAAFKKWVDNNDEKMINLLEK